MRSGQGLIFLAFSARTCRTSGAHGGLPLGFCPKHCRHTGRAPGSSSRGSVCSCILPLLLRMLSCLAKMLPPKLLPKERDPSSMISAEISSHLKPFRLLVLPPDASPISRSVCIIHHMLSFWAYEYMSESFPNWKDLCASPCLEQAHEHDR